MPKISTALAVVLITITPAYCGDWHRFQSGDIEVITDVAGNSGAAIVEALLPVRAVLPARNPRPIRAVLFRSDRDFRRFRREPAVAGFYVAGPDCDWIAIEDHGGRNRLIAVHEYVHAVMNRNTLRLPLWFEEGLAEFYSSVEFRRTRVVLGGWIESHLALARTQPLLTAVQMSGQEATENRPLFYAQSWLLVHMLQLDPRYRSSWDRFSAALIDGTEFDTALRMAFGDLANPLQNLPGYARSPRSPVSISQPAPAREPVQVQLLPEDEWLTLQAQLQDLIRHPDEAAALIEEAARIRPDSTGVRLSRASQAIRENRLNDARALIELAIQDGARGGDIHFELAGVLRTSHAPAGRVIAELERAVAESPGHSMAHLLLGTLLDDAGRHERALEHLRRAAELEPRNAFNWQALALSCRAAGETDAAREAARRANAAAQTPEEIAMAAALEDHAGASQPRRPQPGGRATEPASTPAAITGRLTSVECSGTQARLLINGLRLEVSRPDEVTIEGAAAGRTWLRCGPQDVPVRVEYDPNTREVRSIQFR